MRGVYTFTTESVIFHQTSLPPSLTAPPCVYLSFLCVAPPSLSPGCLTQRRGHPTAEDQLFPYGEGTDEGSHKEAGGGRGHQPRTQPSTHTHTHTHTHTQLPNRLLQPAAEETPEWIPVSLSLSLSFFSLHRLQQMCSAEAAGARKSRENRAERGGGRGAFRPRRSTLISRRINLLSV